MSLPDSKVDPHSLYWLAAFGAVFMVAFAVQCSTFMRSNSQTFDEAVHLAAGYTYLATRDFRLNAEHPPLIKELCALPAYLLDLIANADSPTVSDIADQFAFGRKFLYTPTVSADHVLTLARLPNVFLGVLLVGAIGAWAYRLWGLGSGLFAGALAACDPNLIANASIVTMDNGATLFFFLTCYLLWEHSRNQSLLVIVSLGVTMGLALSTKYSMVLLPCIVAALLTGDFFMQEQFEKTASPVQREPLAKLWHRVVAPVFLIFCVAATAVVLTYLPQSPLTWWKGLQWQIGHDERGHSGYFMGEYSNEGWICYFPVALALKTPLGTLLMLGCGLLCCRGRGLSWREWLFLVAPPSMFLGFIMQTSINIGVRYALPVYPFLLVMASRLVSYRLSRMWLTPAISLGLLVLTIASSARICPHYLAYFNEFAGGPSGGSHYLLDSNLDWGQDLRGVKTFMQRMGVGKVYLSYFGTAPPDHYDIHFQVLPSFSPQASCTSKEFMTNEARDFVVISANNLYGLYAEDHDFYRWLREQPVAAHIGYSLYVFDITKNAGAHVELGHCYAKIGMDSHSMHEARRALAIDPGNEEAARLLSKVNRVSN